MDYTITRGNNVHAQEDRDNNDNTIGSPATSTTAPDPLNFNFTPDFTVVPEQTTPVQNQQFNITNLFYWNNITHDITYQYGFDEAAGNFQNANQGRGGVGGDYVIADAQDAGGTGNANFATPPDGMKPRMQMYLWNGSPKKDGDADNGIIVHEYGHGITNRLTGGPANTSCLQNGEQMGEGWSDYYALMYTQDWATANLATGFTTPRGIGTYVLNQPATGVGIRSQRYCTNFAINNLVYASTISTAQHNRGEIWCATLWDMTWNIINQVGSINPNIFNPSAGGGNAIAIRLVTEGLKLQPCSPGFISGRNAILQADQILYGGQFNCAIREAFRRRGMGDNASQGSSGSVTDQVADFNAGVTFTLTQNGMTQVPEGQNIVYTNTVNSSCLAVSGYTLRDTLPMNVTYVSGGTYNAATRVVSFPVTQAAGVIQNYSFTVNVNPGSYFTPVTLLNEQVTGSSIPASWTTSALPAANVWTVSNLQSQSPPNSFYVANLTVAADQKLETTNAIVLPAATSPKLSFSHRFNTEDGWDGGVVEISANGGAWTDLGPNMVTGAYNGTLGNNPPNILSDRSAFTGTINSFMNTSINLTPYAGQSVKFRFRFGSDDNTSAPSGTPGWFVDNIILNIEPVVNMRSSMFNAANVRLSKADTVTVIIPSVTCSNVNILTQPTNVNGCVGFPASFSVSASGTNATYQWQVSTDGGANWINIGGANSTTYTILLVTAAMNNNQYRVIVNNSCPSSSTSSAVVLNVSNSGIISQPQNVSGCTGTVVNIGIQAAGAATTYQWQVSINNGPFTNLSNNATYSGVNTNTLTISGLTSAMDNYRYQVLLSNTPCGNVVSNIALLQVKIKPVIILNADRTILSPGVTTLLHTTTTPAGTYTYSWFRNGQLIPGVSGENYLADIDNTGSYSVIATDASGCKDTSNILQISDSATNIVFIYPNPNTGIFQVRFYNQGSQPKNRIINVFDAKGAKVYARKYNVSGAYDNMKVDLTKMAAGIYLIEVVDAAGVRLAAGKVLIN